jgi:hypothetical protein
MKTRLALLLCVVGVSSYAQSPGTLTATGSMTTPRGEHTATLLQDGRVLLAGGNNHGNFTNTAELYDPSTGTFTATGSMATTREYSTATLLPDGSVLIAGGIGGPRGDALLSAELYDPDTGTFSATGSMATSYSSATLLRSGKILMTGSGFASELYDPDTGTFRAAGAYANGSLGNFPTATLLTDGRVLVTGCALTDDSGNCLVDQEVTQLYDPATDTFSLGTTTYHCPGIAASLLPNGKVLFVGSVNKGYNWVPCAALYDPSTDNFTPTGSISGRSADYTTTLLPDGRVLSTGTGTAELYDPTSGTFSSMADKSGINHKATLLKDGRVLITGGYDTLVFALSSAELYTALVFVPPPALFSLSGDGRGQGAIWHAQTGQIASADNPAVAGEALSMYTTSLIKGGVIPPQVAVADKLAEVLFFGDAPGYPGYFQVNFRMPSGVAPGSAVSVRLTYIGRPSNAVTIGVQ